MTATPRHEHISLSVQSYTPVFWQDITRKSFMDYINSIHSLDSHTSKAFIELTKADTVANPSLYHSAAHPQNHASKSSLSGSLAGSLAGIPFGIKDNIAVHGFALTCGSKLLSEFRTPYTAHAVSALLDEGAIPIGKTNLDEFGMGSSTTQSAWGISHNPWDLERSAGGSSGGSAIAVAAGYVPFTLGSDTGGSVRMPASLCGVWGFKPSYGNVSRYGLVAYASSFDVIGIIANHPSWLTKVYTCIAIKHDSTLQDFKDASVLKNNHTLSQQHSASQTQNKQNTTQETKQKGTLNYKHTHFSRNCKIGVFKPTSGLDQAHVQAFDRAKTVFDSMNQHMSTLKTEPITIRAVEYSASVYYILCTAEASANLARFDGIRYGKRDAYTDTHQELIRVARSRGFGNEVILRILTGTFVLQSGFQDQYYLKAQELRRQITHELNTLFKDYDYILMPSFPRQAFCFDDTSMDSASQKIADAYSVLANISGIPAVSVPLGLYNGLPVGLQLMAPRFCDQQLLEFVEQLATSEGYHQLDGVDAISPIHTNFLEQMHSLDSTTHSTHDHQ